MIGINRNLLSSNLLGEKVAASGAVVSSNQRDFPKVWETVLPVQCATRSTAAASSSSISSNGDIDLNNLSAESIEIYRSSSSIVESVDQSVWTSLFSWFSTTASSSSTAETNRSHIAVPLQDHQKVFLAMKVNTSVLVCRSIDRFLSSQSLEFLVLNKLKLRGETCSIAWSNDQSPVLLIGTTSGLTIVRLPSPSTAENVPMDHANVEVRALTCVNFPVTSISASPLGRLAVISSGHKVYLLDIWQDQLSLIHSSGAFSSSEIEKVLWSNCNNKVYVHYR